MFSSTECQNMLRSYSLRSKARQNCAIPFRRCGIQKCASSSIRVYYRLPSEKRWDYTIFISELYYIWTKNAMPDTREKAEWFFCEAFCFSSSGKSFSGCTSSIRMIQCYSISEMQSLLQVATQQRRPSGRYHTKSAGSRNEQAAHHRAEH